MSCPRYLTDNLLLEKSLTSYCPVINCIRNVFLCDVCPYRVISNTQRSVFCSFKFVVRYSIFPAPSGVEYGLESFTERNHVKPIVFVRAGNPTPCYALHPLEVYDA